MFRFIKNLFSGLVAFIKGLFGGDKKQTPSLDQSNNRLERQSEPQLESKPVATNSQTENTEQGTFFLEGAEARGFSSANGDQNEETQPASGAVSKSTATANSFNLPQPKVTSSKDFANFSNRRRPGANMSSFLEMAREMRTSS